MHFSVSLFFSEFSSHFQGYHIGITMLVPIVTGLCVDEARRLSVIGEVAVSGSINAREWIQSSFACRLGPWQWPLNESDTSEIVALLDEGGQKAIITVDGSIDQVGTDYCYYYPPLPLRSIRCLH